MGWWWTIGTNHSRADPCVVESQRERAQTPDDHPLRAQTPPDLRKRAPSAGEGVRGTSPHHHRARWAKAAAQLHAGRLWVFLPMLRAGRASRFGRF
jgi:hypothetical protein